MISITPCSGDTVFLFTTAQPPLPSMSIGETQPIGFCVNHSGSNKNEDLYSAKCKLVQFYCLGS